MLNILLSSAAVLYLLRFRQKPPGRVEASSQDGDAPLQPNGGLGQPRSHPLTCPVCPIPLESRHGPSNQTSDIRPISRTRSGTPPGRGGTACTSVSCDVLTPCARYYTDPGRTPIWWRGRGAARSRYNATTRDRRERVPSLIHVVPIHDGVSLLLLPDGQERMCHSALPACHGPLPFLTNSVF